MFFPQIFSDQMTRICSFSLERFGIPAGSNSAFRLEPREQSLSAERRSSWGTGWSNVRSWRGSPGHPPWCLKTPWALTGGPRGSAQTLEPQSLETVHNLGGKKKRKSRFKEMEFCFTKLGTMWDNAPHILCSDGIFYYSYIKNLIVIRNKRLFSLGHSATRLEQHFLTTWGHSARLIHFSYLQHKAHVNECLSYEDEP